MIGQRTPPAIASHRGASRRYPENSLAAFAEAINIAMLHPEQPFFLEMDVRLSADGVPVLIHDASVDRTTEGMGAVNKHTFAQLQALPMKPVSRIIYYGEEDTARAQPPFFPITEADIRVPALEEVIALVRAANQARGEALPRIGICLEIKTDPPSPYFPARLGQAFMNIAISLLQVVRLGSVAAELGHQTRSVQPLAEMLNARAEAGTLNFPLIAFSAAGALGKRDIHRLWNQLTPQAKADLVQLPAQELPVILDEETVALAVKARAPHQAKAARHCGSQAIQDTAQDVMFTLLDNHWMIGGLPPRKGASAHELVEGAPLLTNFFPLNDTTHLDALLKGGITLITTDHPERMAQALHERQVARTSADEETGRPAPRREYAEIVQDTRSAAPAPRVR